MFSKRLAMDAIHACRVAMQPREEHAANVSFFECEESDTQAVVLDSDKCITIAYRATEVDEKQDILTDLKFRKVRPLLHHSMNTIHRGMLSGMESLFSPLALRVQEAHNAGKSVNIAGHSLGGGEGTIFANMAQREGYRIDSVYTYGTPRTHSWSASARFNDILYTRTYSFFNHRDPVPSLPPARWNFQHCGNIGYFNRAGNLLWNPNPLRIAWDRAKGFGKDIVKEGIQWWDYHGLDRYERLISLLQ